MLELPSDWAAAYFLMLSSAVALGLALEARWPRLPLRHSMRVRWMANGLMLVVNQLLLRLLFPVTVVSAAWWARQQGLGLLNTVSVSHGVTFVVSVLAIDLASYGFHRLVHRFAWLWRIHRLHHSDPDVDVTTGFRFHPIESLCQAGVAAGAAIAIGASPAAAVAYLLLLSVVSMMSHVNVRVPPWLDRALKLVVITPFMHRAHHSVSPEDYNSNFGTCLSLWDRVFASYRAVPSVAYERMIFGVDGRSPAEATAVTAMLADPFLPERDAKTAETSPEAI